MARFLESFRRMVQPLEGAWLCSSIRPSLHSNFYRLFGTRRNGVDQAWSNGMVVILLTLGVFTWWRCINQRRRA